MKFDEILFMGNSVPGSTDHGIVLLHEILNEALSELSGLQQSYEDAGNSQKIRRAVRDIAMALTGSEITFTNTNKNEYDNFEDFTFDHNKFIEAVSEMYEEWLTFMHKEHISLIRLPDFEEAIDNYKKFFRKLIGD